MAEQVLYRKYRSADFNDVIGQAHVVQTLTNAVASGRVAHAYLFTGPRGVGKTSVARLLARALNCTGDAKPCNKCNNCLAAINSSLDVIEIDAASNRRIEEIRDLRDKINLAPTMGSHKVYIIDEVHMLTTEAFNALLKTLEEPPSHVVLILATTEVHKLPETIVSRTQRFTFNPIGHNDLIGRLKYIAGLENITIDDDALELIAGAARGGFRDAISLLDQVAATGISPVTVEVVRQHLGWSDPKLVEGLIRAVVAGEAKAVLVALDQLIRGGAQAGQLASELVRAWRAALAAAAGSGTASGAVEELAKAWSLTRLASSLESLVVVGKSPWPEVSLEATLVSLACPAETAQVAAPKASKAAKPAAPVAATPTAIEEVSETPAQTEAPKDLWPKALLIIKERHNALFAIVSACQFRLEGNDAILTSKFNFHRDRLNEPKNRQIIEQALSKVYGQDLAVKAVTGDAPKARTRTTNPTAELVSSALEILGGEVVDGEN